MLITRLGTVPQEGAGRRRLQLWMSREPSPPFIKSAPPVVKKCCDAIDGMSFGAENDDDASPAPSIFYCRERNSWRIIPRALSSSSSFRFRDAPADAHNLLSLSSSHKSHKTARVNVTVFTAPSEFNRTLSFHFSRTSGQWLTGFHPPQICIVLQGRYSRKEVIYGSCWYGTVWRMRITNACLPGVHFNRD